MAFPSSFRDREQAKFKATPSNNTAVRVCVDSDSPVPVYITDSTGSSTASVFDEANAVSSGVETDIVSYTVPASKKLYLEFVQFSGQNISEYKLKVNGSVIRKHWTYYTEFSGSFDFRSQGDGPFYVAGDIILLTTIHSRPSPGDYFASIQGVLVDV